MAITYAAPTITVDNLAAQDWHDIYLADVGGGWGVVTEVVQDAMYLCDANLLVGAGVNTTSMVSLNEHVYFSGNFYLQIAAAATLTLGAIVGSWGYNGSMWTLSGPNNGVNNLLNGGDLFLYASRLHTRTNTNQNFDSGNFTAINSQLSSMFKSLGGVKRRYTIGPNMTSVALKDVFYTNSNFFQFSIVPDIDDLHIHYGNFGFRGTGPNVRIANCRFTSLDGVDIDTYSAAAGQERDTTVINAKAPIASVSNTTGVDNATQEAYYVTLRVTDKTGLSVSSADVLIVDAYGNTVSYYNSLAELDGDVDALDTDIDVDDGTKFTAGDIIKIDDEYMLIDSIAADTLTVTREYYGANYMAKRDHADEEVVYIVAATPTGAGGLPDVGAGTNEMRIGYKCWIGTGETLKEYSPHVITVSKTNYETLVMEDVIIDAPADWRFELQDRIKTSTDGKQYEAIKGQMVRPL